MDYLLKPSPPFVAGLTLCVADARATAVAKIRIKQFWAIPLAGKVVAPCPVMAMPLFLLHRDVESRSRTHGAAGRIASGSDRYRHEDVSRMAGRTATDARSPWLGDEKLAPPSKSNVNPLEPNAKSGKPKPMVSPMKTLKLKPMGKAFKRPR
jgi:hypothetical protein